MKLIHCSDLHLDSALGSNFTPEKAQQRNAELCAAFAVCSAQAGDIPYQRHCGKGQED